MEGVGNPFFFVGTADSKNGTGDFLGKEAKILTAHGRFDRGNRMDDKLVLGCFFK